MKIIKVIQAFCLAGILMSSSLYAQDTLKQQIPHPLLKNELSVTLGPLYSNEIIIYEIDSSMYQTIQNYNPILGFGYKNHYNKSALRTKVALLLKDGEDFNLKKSKGQSAYTSVGYEWYKKEGKLLLSYGADLVASFVNTNAVYYEHNHSKIAEKRINIKKLGLSPFIGFSYCFTPHVSVTTEFHYTIAESVRNTKTTDENAVVNANKEFVTSFSMSPLGNLALNIHF